MKKTTPPKYNECEFIGFIREGSIKEGYNNGTWETAVYLGPDGKCYFEGYSEMFTIEERLSRAKTLKFEILCPTEIPEGPICQVYAAAVMEVL